jgi:hypothetical protein
LIRHSIGAHKQIKRGRCIPFLVCKFFKNYGKQKKNNIHIHFCSHVHNSTFTLIVDNKGGRTDKKHSFIPLFLNVKNLKYHARLGERKTKKSGIVLNIAEILLKVALNTKYQIKS